MATKKDFSVPYDVLDGLVPNARNVEDLGFIPSVFNKPTNKATQALFEELDLTIYHPDTKVAFRIGPDPGRNRVLCWWKALKVFYMYLNTKKGYEIKDKIIVTSKNKRKSLEILVQQRGETEGYRLCFFVATGTVLVQGKKFRDFSDFHFPCIKYLFEKIHAVGDDAGSEDAGGEDKGGDDLLLEEEFEEDGAGDNEADEAEGELVNLFQQVKLKDVGSDKKR